MDEGLLPDNLRKELQTAWVRYLDIVEPLRPQLHRYCRRMTGTIWDAEDLSQETLLKGFAIIGRRDEQRDGCSQPGDVHNPRAYLFRIATNLWIDAVRRNEAGERRANEAEADPVRTDIGGVREAATLLIERASPQSRAAVVLKEVFDFTLEQIAEILATSVGTIKSALHRGRAELQKPLTVTRERRRKPSRELLDQFVDAFNRRDAPRVAALLLEQVSIEVQGVGGERGRGANWIRFAMSGYAGDRTDRHWLECRELAGEPLVIHLTGTESDPILEEVWRFEEDEGKIARIKDYCYCPETLTELGAQLNLQVITHGYHGPEEKGAVKFRF
jgi:RNA polymerase sigma-70 factor, ECF subfamily